MNASDARALRAKAAPDARTVTFRPRTETLTCFSALAGTIASTH
jgi:hypothetical protein